MKVKLLFIKLRHFGDALLLTPTLTAVRQQLPKAEITVLTRRGCEGILAGCPAIDRILTTAEPEQKNRRASGWQEDVRLLLSMRRDRFDYAFELSESERGRWMGWLARPRQLCLQSSAHPLGAWWRSRATVIANFGGFLGHTVEKDFYTVKQLLQLPDKIPPFSFSREKIAPSFLDSLADDFVVIHPGTRWQRKRWLDEKWDLTGFELLKRFRYVVVSSSAEGWEVELSKRLANKLGKRVILTEGRLNWAQLAGVLYRAALVVGVDTAVIHLAAACQRPVVVLYGPSFEGHWRPWQTNHVLVLPPGFAELTADTEDISVFLKRRTADIRTSDVLAACDQLLPARNPPSQTG